MEKFKIGILLYLELMRMVLCVNYVVNGGFELPAIPFGTDIFQGAVGWNGSTYQVMNRYRTLGHQQYIDLSGTYGVNGYIQQQIILSYPGSYNLSFLQQANTTDFDSYVMEVHWNGQLIATQIANTTDTTYHSFLVYGHQGSNLLSFYQIGVLDWAGMYLDEVSVSQFVSQYQGIYSNNANSTNYAINQTVITNLINQTTQSTTILKGGQLLTNVESVIAILFPSFFSQVTGARCAYLFAEDLWLYHYDKKEYEGLISLIFNMTATIELMKFDVLEKTLHWEQYNRLQISDYLPYTRKRFIQIEHTSSVLIEAALPFFIYIVPENLLVYLLLYLLFIMVSRCQVSKFIRKFYFIKTVFLQALIEGNLVYFVYVCLGHLSTSFYLRFWDKLSLVFTVLFLWVITVSAFVFYPLMGNFLGKKASYFLYSCYRCNPGYLFLTIKYLVRNYLRGAVFYFFHHYFIIEMTLLSLIEVAVIIVTMSLEMKKQIFISKTFYCLWLVYHFLFIILNFSLYLGSAFEPVLQDEQLKEIALTIQATIIYSLIASVILTIVFDFMPLNWLKSKRLDEFSGQNTQAQQSFFGNSCVSINREDTKWQKFLSSVRSLQRKKEIRLQKRNQLQLKLKQVQKAEENIFGNERNLRLYTIIQSENKRLSEQQSILQSKQQKQQEKPKTMNKLLQREIPKQNKTFREKEAKSKSKNALRIEVKIQGNRLDTFFQENQ